MASRTLGVHPSDQCNPVQGKMFKLYMYKKLHPKCCGQYIFQILIYIGLLFEYVTKEEILSWLQVDILINSYSPSLRHRQGKRVKGIV